MPTPRMSAHHIPFFVLVPQAAEGDKNKKPSDDTNGKEPDADTKSKPVEDNKTKSAAGKKGKK